MMKTLSRFGAVYSAKTIGKLLPNCVSCESFKQPEMHPTTGVAVTASLPGEYVSRAR